jgi:hypothetical protein
MLEGYFDPQPGDDYYKGFEVKDQKGMLQGIITSVDPVNGLVSGDLLNYKGTFKSARLLFPLVGANFGIVGLPSKGDLVEVVYDNLSKAYARPTISYRYFDFRTFLNSKPTLKSGELFLYSSGGAFINLTKEGGISISEVNGNNIILDSKNGMRFESPGNTSMVSGLSSCVSGGVKRNIVLPSGEHVFDFVDDFVVPGSSPFQEVLTQVFPKQPVIPGIPPKKRVYVQLGDIFDSSTPPVQDPLIVAKGGYEDEFGTELFKYTVGIDGSINIEVKSPTAQVNITAQNINLKGPGITNILKKLVDERFLASYSTHTHPPFTALPSPIIGEVLTSNVKAS